MMYHLNKNKIREIDHTADIGIVVVGDTRDELFANLAFGMMQIITENIPPSHDQRSIQLEETSLEDLVVLWLTEINYLVSVHHFFISHIEQLKISDAEDIIKLRATLIGSYQEAKDIYYNTEIKAITYHQLRYEEKDNQYHARVIFDI
jgi:SHS2 domain-containing protein